MFMDANTNPDAGATGVGEEEGDVGGPWWTMVFARLSASIVDLGDKRRGDNSLGDCARLCRCLRATGEADDIGEGEGDDIVGETTDDVGDEDNGAGRWVGL